MFRLGVEEAPKAGFLGLRERVGGGCCCWCGKVAAMVTAGGAPGAGAGAGSGCVGGEDRGSLLPIDQS